jgi:predicted PurR-regulated permease PerM
VISSFRGDPFLGRSRNDFPVTQKWSIVPKFNIADFSGAPRLPFEWIALDTLDIDLRLSGLDNQSPDDFAMNKIDLLPTEVPPQETKGQQLAGIAAALGLVALAIWTLSTFLPALAWATILAIATWPLYVIVRPRAGRTGAAAIVTFLIAVAVLAPLVVAAVEAVQELRGVALWLVETRRSGFQAPDWIADLPLVGGAVADWLNTHMEAERNPFAGADVAALTEWGRIIGRQAARRTTTLLFALLIVFFIFRESETLIGQARAVGERLLGPQAEKLGVVAAGAVRATVDGLLLIGLAEAVLIGIAYAVAGVPHPALFGVLTGLFSAIPFASPIVFIGAGVWLVTQSEIAAAIGVVVFGSVVVFVADHFVRPVLIGGSARLPFIWVLLGILGGIESFGLLGIFLGPVLLAVLITLWRELAAHRSRM